MLWEETTMSETIPDILSDLTEISNQQNKIPVKNQNFIYPKN